MVCPLDWGLGHATRCVPIIRALLDRQVEVVIGADGGPLALLQQEFPDLEYIVFPGYKVTYPANGRMALHMARLAPSILRSIRNEHYALKKLVVEHQLDAVISDNRFGLWHPTLPTLYMTHQINIKANWLEGVLGSVHQKYINRFSVCWVPDVAGAENLSGDLAHKFPLPSNARWVGVLSRFFTKEITLTSLQYDVMAIISGPEPQRSTWEQLVLEQLYRSDLKALVVTGNAEKKISKKSGNATIVSHLSAKEMRNSIMSSEVVLCRSGYSSVMDLSALGAKAMLVPTPGQTEQEYLARYHHEKGHFFSQTQSQFDLSVALEAAKDFKGIRMQPSGLLENAVDDFLTLL